MKSYSRPLVCFLGSLMKRMMTKRHSQLIEKDGKYRGRGRGQRRESGSVVGEVEKQQMKRKGREGSGEEGGELESG